MAKIEIVKDNSESYESMLVRLYENRNKYGLSWQDVADEMNDAFGFNYGESKYRKEIGWFVRGIQYERNRTEGGVALRILSISDLHVPFQKPIATFKDYAGRVDVLQFNGDIVDFAGISSFTKVYRASPMEEIIEARQYLIDLIEMIGPRRVVFTYGNHDIRFQNYFAKNLDSDLLELMPETELDLIVVDGFYHYDKRQRTKAWYAPLREVFPEIAIEYHGKWFCQIGNTIFCHPLAFKRSIMKTASDAMLWFRNEGFVFDALVMGHTHRIGDYKVGNTTLYEQGACCETEKMTYSNGKLVNSQKQGFIYLAQDAEGNLLRDATRLICLN